MTPLHQLSNWLVNINNLQVCSWYVGISGSCMTSSPMSANSPLSIQFSTIQPPPPLLKLLPVYTHVILSLSNWRIHNPETDPFCKWYWPKTGRGAARNLQQPQTPKTKEQQTGFQRNRGQEKEMHKFHDGIRVHCLGCGQHGVVKASSCLQSCLTLLYGGCLLRNSVTL